MIEYAGGSTVTYNGALRLDRAAPFIKNTTVRHSASAGIHYFGGDSSNLRMIGCTLSDNAQSGVSVQANSGYTELSDSIIDNNNATGALLSYVEGNGTYVVTGNTIRKNKGGDFSGVQINTRAPVVFKDNLVIENGPGSGLATVLIQAHAAEITGNLVINNDGGGMLIGSYYDYLPDVRVVSNNIISDNNGIGLRLYSYSGSAVNASHNAILRNTAENDAGLTVLYLDAGSSITYNTILGNLNTGSTALRTSYFNYNTWGSPVFNYNNLTGNNGYALYNDNTQGLPNIDAVNNWWGTSSSTEIQALIYDYFDDTTRGIVDYSPYLSALELDAPVSPPSGFTLAPSDTSFDLSWLANPEADRAGYKIYYDTDSKYPYDGTGADQGDSPIDVGNVTSFTLTGLDPGTRYYFAVTAYDTDTDGSEDQKAGNESWFSLENSAELSEPPAALFSAAPLSGPAPLNVSFTNASTGDYTTCAWDFGDGGTSTSCVNPSHTYASAGVYTVSLTVSGLGGTDTETKVGYITVYAPVEADFSAAPTSGPASLLVSFTNLSSGDYATCSWSFGDGGTSTSCVNPSHTYASAGVYTVSLTVSGLGGTDTETKASYITVYAPVAANFSAAPTSGPASLLVSFTNLSSGDYTTCSWNFGDGGSSTSCVNPSHTYASAGVYTVSLTVSGLGGTDTETKVGYITVYAPVAANFSAAPTSGPASLLVNFTNLSSGDYATCSWNFGDGGSSTSCVNPSHTYASAGVYTVSLTVSGLGGTDTETKASYITVYVPVAADFSADPTKGPVGMLVSFTNLSSGDYATCDWNFGDGGTSTSCSGPTHTYTSAGFYTVSLTVSGPGGTDTETKVDYITAYAPVMANFSATPTSGLAPVKVNFTNLSSGTLTSCAWDFGDGGTSTNCGNPSHTYETAGLYTVSLTVSGPEGTDTETKIDYILAYAPVTANFTATPISGLVPLEVSFSNLSLGTVTSCTWNFGDGTTSSVCDDPVHTYVSAGVYTVTLTVSGPAGSFTLTKMNYIEVWYGVYVPLVMRN
ncbi:MAG: PKD domain-containing protein [Anaerolineales bacterium]|nr:PKD domain-containing protein [Anaerolineales bacterium]